MRSTATQGRRRSWVVAAVVALVFGGLGGNGAVVDVGGIVVKAAKDAVRERMISEKAASRKLTSFSCESTVVKTTYAKPVVELLMMIYCTNEATYDTWTIEAPINISGTNVTEACDAEEYIEEVQCYGFARVSTSFVVFDEGEVSRTTSLYEYDDLHAWTSCVIKGPRSCGSSFVATDAPVREDYDTILPGIYNEKKTVARTFTTTSSLGGAWAVVFTGPQDVSKLYENAWARVSPEIEEAERKSETRILVLRRKTYPLLHTMMKGTMVGVRSFGVYIPQISSLRTEIVTAFLQGSTPLEDEHDPPTPTPIPEFDVLVAERTPTPTPTTTTSFTDCGESCSEKPECIDAAWAATHHEGFEVHSEAVLAPVLCFGSLPCATRDHVVVRDGSLLTMRELCAVESCSSTTMLVNGVQHVRSKLMPCDRGVCMTTLDERSRSVWKRAENILVHFLLRSGSSRVAQVLTRAQIAAAVRSENQ
mmetsp:Transcript_2727/g.5995  ORF Transcript_2727/g.5995 Transcript_2727/m.5995 type:complete len:477 (-) Transcript_2727:115-1545(-)